MSSASISSSQPIDDERINELRCELEAVQELTAALNAQMRAMSTLHHQMRTVMDSFRRLDDVNAHWLHQQEHDPTFNGH